MSRATPEAGARPAQLPPRSNPFRTERLDRFAYRSPATGAPLDPAPLVDRFEELGRRAAIVGPEGTGKTALLDTLAAELSVRGWDVRRLRAAPGGGELAPDRSGGAASSGDAALDAPAPTTLLVVDGLDRLHHHHRRRVHRAARVAAGLLATAHRPLRLPPLPTLLRCTTTPELLETLIAELTADGQTGAVRRPHLPSATALHARHRGNLRTALLELYDLCAGRGTGCPTVR